MNNRYGRLFRLCCNISEIVERFLKFLNRNTFIMVAIHGNPFCQSMRDAFNLLMRNIASVYVTNKVTALQFGVFILAITLGMGGLTYAFIPEHELRSELAMYPIYASMFGSFLVASTFFGVYAMAIDTLFLCFCKCMLILVINSVRLSIYLLTFVVVVLFSFQWKIVNVMTALKNVHITCHRN